MMKKIQSKILYAFIFALIHVPPTWALESTNTQVEATLQRFLDLVAGGKIAYFLLVGGVILAGIGIVYSGIGKNWPLLINTLIGGGLLFGVAGLFQFFFGVNVDSLLLP